MTEDNLLVEQLASDLDQAFPAFVSSYDRFVYSIALRVVGDREQAIDLAADSFHRAYKALTDYPPVRIRQLKLRSWMATIVVNLCRNAARDAARRPRQVVLDEALLVASNAASPELAAVQLDGERALAASLLRLSDQQRVAVVLHHVVGLSYEEVAATLSCPVNTARSHVARGLSRLRDILEKESVNS